VKFNPVALGLNRGFLGRTPARGHAVFLFCRARRTACISFEVNGITEILSTAYWKHVKFCSTYMMYLGANKSNEII